jgi:hypothetical protein
MNDGLTIAFPATDTTDQRRTKIAAMAEGAVLVNMAEIADGASLNVDSLRYEEPRAGTKTPQRIGSFMEVVKRRRATCLEIACIVVAAERTAGRGCYVKVVSTRHRGRVVRFRYHAVVVHDDGSVLDASEILDGYSGAGHWWQRSGHHCESCALDNPCGADYARTGGR